ncbi:MAG: mannose-1-phosphate guanylyltransferase [Bdellovibrionales bacterium]|nr:mannose-1-phosphate guanylyltransferase [Bdellovibrionales bacterium]
MNSDKTYCLVMAGGRGTRFWPESTKKKPKQYLSLVGSNSLLQDSLMRFDPLVSKDNRYVVTIKEQEDLAKEHSNNLVNKNGIIFEPNSRNTAPCILLSVAQLLKQGAGLDEVVAIMPADHVILNTKGFQETIQSAISLSKEHSSIVTIGIRPSFPHTGFGYIHRQSEVQNNCFTVNSFKEKPDQATATSYVQSGEYFWNAGMFVSTIGCLLEQFKVHAPGIYSFFEGLKDNLNNWDELCHIYSQMPDDSIDYAIMEKTKDILVIEAKFDWNDLGSWDALESVLPQKQENTVISEKGSFIDGSSGNIIFAKDQHVSLVNIKDLIVVSNKNALVVLPKKDCQKVKEIVKHLEEDESGKKLL